MADPYPESGKVLGNGFLGYERNPVAGWRIKAFPLRDGFLPATVSVIFEDSIKMAEWKDFLKKSKTGIPLVVGAK